MLKARVLTALVLLGVFLFALFLLPAFGWAAFVALAIGLASWEWAGLGGFEGRSRIVYGLISAVLTSTLAALLHGPFAAAAASDAALPIYVLAGLFWLLVVPMWLVRKWRLGSPLLTALVGWVVLLPAGLALLQIRAFDPAAVLAVMAAVWVADIAAYFVGRAFGRHKLAPLISPGKTWEGAAGALVAVIAYGFAVLAATGSLTRLGVAAMLAALGALMLLTAVSIAGDLFESLLKRQAGIKDSGSILPGHGGVLDRIDSLTSALPLVCIAFILWNR